LKNAPQKAAREILEWYRALDGAHYTRADLEYGFNISRRQAGALFSHLVSLEKNPQEQTWVVERDSYGIRRQDSQMFVDVTFEGLVQVLKENA
jgi:hypothetical protein